MILVLMFLVAAFAAWMFGRNFGSHDARGENEMVQIELKGMSMGKRYALLKQHTLHGGALKWNYSDDLFDTVEKAKKAAVAESRIEYQVVDLHHGMKVVAAAGCTDAWTNYSATPPLEHPSRIVWHEVSL